MTYFKLILLLLIFRLGVIQLHKRRKGINKMNKLFSKLGQLTQPKIIIIIKLTITIQQSLVFSLYFIKIINMSFTFFIRLGNCFGLLFRLYYIFCRSILTIFLLLFLSLVSSTTIHKLSFNSRSLPLLSSLSFSFLLSLHSSFLSHFSSFLSLPFCSHLPPCRTSFSFFCFSNM